MRVQPHTNLIGQHHDERVAPRVVPAQLVLLLLLGLLLAGPLGQAQLEQHAAQALLPVLLRHQLHLLDLVEEDGRVAGAGL